jgi:beta-glucanase (GH16 family)
MTTLDLTGYSLTFDEEFNNASISQTGAGTIWADIRSEWRGDANADVGFGNSSFVDAASGYDPFSVDDGVLSITAVPDRTPWGVPGSWESGLITTQGNFSQTYGYFEVRADFSALPGAWDAFWLLPDQAVPDPNNAGRWQEIDVVEHYGSSDKGVYSGIHTTDAAPNLHWQDDLQVYSELSQPGGFHTYGVDWEKDTTSFYVDGQFVGSHPTPSDMHGPMYVLANLATQNDPNNNANVANVPITSSIDYIHVYSPPAPGTSGTSAGGTSTSDTSTSGTSTSAPTAATIGSGSDQLRLSISEDAFNGDAQYTVSVDGTQIGDVQTAHALHSAGQSDALLVQGNWGGGTHDVAVNFLNDAYNGVQDRNLYIDSATYNGVDVPNAQHALLSAGLYDFSLSSPAPGTSDTSTSDTSTSAPTAAIIGSGSDQLRLSISEDAFNGDAQYTVSVDGTQIGDVQTAHALHSAGQSDALLVQGDWGGGTTHDVAVNFLNDAYNGVQDRNLYIDSATYNGVDVPTAQHALLSAGPYDFFFHF